MKTANETSLCFFEDRQSDFFKPLILTRPMDDLRVGIYTIREKWLQALHTTSYQRKLRPELRGIFDSPHESAARSEEHTSELQSRGHLVCRLLLEKKKTKKIAH